jgi:cytochrome c556
MVHKSLIGLAAALMVSGAAMAQDDGPHKMQVKARQGVMNYYQINLMTLGAMAKGDTPYDAAAAKVAADNIVAASNLDISMLWPQGSDNGAHPATRALPAVWAEGSDIGAKSDAMKKAAVALAAAAGTDVEALKTGIDGLGAACTACHKSFRQAD